MSLAKDSNGNVAQVGRLGVSADRATSTTSASYTVVNAGCMALRVNPSVDTRIRIGSGTVTAVATDTLVSAGATEYFAASYGEKLAAYSATAGALNITEIV